MRDIFERGARIVFADPLVAHVERLELQIPINAMRHQCRVVWCGETELGVAFLDVGSAEQSSQAMAQRMGRLEAEVESLKQIVRALRRDADADSAA